MSSSQVEQKPDEIAQAINNLAAAILTTIYYFPETVATKYQVGNVFMMYRDLLEDLSKNKDIRDG